MLNTRVCGGLQTRAPSYPQLTTSLSPQLPLLLSLLSLFLLLFFFLLFLFPSSPSSFFSSSLQFSLLPFLPLSLVGSLSCETCQVQELEGSLVAWKSLEELILQLQPNSKNSFLSFPEAVKVCFVLFISKVFSWSGGAFAVESSEVFKVFKASCFKI